MTVLVTVVSPFPNADPPSVEEIVSDPEPITDTNRGNNGVTNTDGNLGFRIFVGTASPGAAGFTPIVGDVWIT